MGCFDCFEIRSSEKRLMNGKLLKKHDCNLGEQNLQTSNSSPSKFSSDKSKVRRGSDKKAHPKDGNPYIAAQTFTFRELAFATRNFRPECFIGEGGFGRVYKGRLDGTGQVVAVKQLDLNGLQGNREFLVEVLLLSLLHHPNLVNLIGYCADGDQRLLVYEYMPLGCLEDHLHDLPPDKQPLDWNTRMKIAAGAAKGLEYLHDKANPPVIYRDFKSSNILLDEGFHPKLSDFGLAKLGPVGDKSHVSTRVMGTYGYCAPEYAMTGQLTVKSDVYSFGVVLLELITGRKAIDNSKCSAEHNLVSWARPLFMDRKKIHQMSDPSLQGQYPMRGLYQATAVAAMCLQEDAATRPLIGDVVTALSYLASQEYDPAAHSVNTLAPSTPHREKKEGEKRLSTAEQQVTNDQGGKDWMIRQYGDHSPPRDLLDHQNGDIVSARTQITYVEGCDYDGGCNRKWDPEEWDRYNVAQNRSPQQAGNTQAVHDRERVVAEAKIWGEGWRERKKGNNGVVADGLHEGLI